LIRCISGWKLLLAIGIAILIALPVVLAVVIRIVIRIGFVGRVAIVVPLGNQT
jgi:hypothetical protein